MKKKIILGIVLLFSLLILWYLFVKKYDYIVTFKEKTSPGTIFHGALEWNENLIKSDLIESKIIKEIAFSNIKQEFKIKDSTIVFNWDFEGINDSITKVTVGVIDAKNSILNRIMLPFTSNGIKQFAINKVVSFKSGLEQHLDKHKVKFRGISEIPEIFCAYVNVESTLEGKAQEMIANNSTVMVFLNENNIKMVGNPFIEVTSWDIVNKNIKFNYCFPVEKMNYLPKHPMVFFKQITAKKALNTTYFGNYRTSDRAWFSVYDHALRNNIKLTNMPLEIFYNNPYMGGNELEWRAEIFIPIEE
ncbi:hypothetical protein [Lutibacter sp.]|uniref:hypothetical protein n=1 Tax=Lutibacter sp. TaxID=1925666 RepID=UPI00273731CF|nr:hypothetical protein [Lutibacter sp.]MDP3314028.1 hypothetical protein [Lutibacter sp.]